MKHVVGTFLLGVAITAAFSAAMYMIVGAPFAYLVAAFFGACTLVATFSDYIEQTDREEYDRRDPPDKIYVGAATISADGEVMFVEGDELPPGMKEFISRVLRDIGEETIEQHGHTLSNEEIAEIEEKFS